MPIDTILAIENKDGGVTTISLSKRKTIDPEEAALDSNKDLIDLDEFLEWNIVQLPNIQANTVEEARALKQHKCKTEDLPCGGDCIRNAWRMSNDGSSIDIDMTIARANKTDKIREPRNKKLENLDMEYMRADEVGDDDTKNSIKTKKQILRDIPATIQPDLEAITDPEELQNFEPIWPEKV
jgi:hypothetical protein